MSEKIDEGEKKETQSERPKKMREKKDKEVKIAMRSIKAIIERMDYKKMR